MNILDAMNNDELFGPHFEGESWAAWKAFLRILFGLPVPAEDLAVVEKCLGGLHFQKGRPFTEAWLVCGRRSGKSAVLGLIAAYAAVLVDWSGRLRAGETPVVLCLAADRRQAGIIFGYVRELLAATPATSALIENVTKETITLSNGVLIEVGTADFRKVRGRTIAVALLDEISFWKSEETTNPDKEVLRALRPALASLAPNSLLLAASSPFGRQGALYDVFREHHGRQSDTLVWRAETMTMNPSLDAALIERDMQADPEAARAEWFAEFRDAVSGFISGAVLDDCIVEGSTRLPREEGVKYVCFVDPSGGGTAATADSFTGAVAHLDKGRDVAVLDAILEIKPPVVPSQAVLQVDRLAREYGLGVVHGDNYAAEWVREEFRKVGAEYQRTKKRATDLYLELLPMLNSARVELLDNATMRRQFLSLQRSVRPGGLEKVDHPRGQHDDIANAVAGALVLAAGDVQDDLLPGAIQCYSDPRGYNLPGEYSRGATVAPPV
jgi:hypothetical protein